MKGQAVVEFALLFPVLMLLVAAGIDGGRLMVAKADQDVRTAMIANYAARHDDDSWNAVANEQLPGCVVTVEEDPHGVVVAGSSCPFEPLALHGLWDGLTVTSEEPAYSPSDPPSASPPPSATPEPSAP